jgi:hypothetical protein
MGCELSVAGRTAREHVLGTDCSPSDDEGTSFLGGHRPRTPPTARPLQLGSLPPPSGDRASIFPAVLAALRPRVRARSSFASTAECRTRASLYARLPPSGLSFRSGLPSPGLRDRRVKGRRPVFGVGFPGHRHAQGLGGPGHPARPGADVVRGSDPEGRNHRNEL